MTAINRILFPGAILAVGLLVVLLKLPHLLLAASLMSGQLHGRPTPVVDMPPLEFPTQTRLLPCGDLRLEVPVETSVEPQPPDELYGLRLKLNGLECRIPPPRHQSDEHETEEINWDAEFNRGGIDWQASVCATSVEDFSFWMSPPQVESLRQQLEAKMYLSLFAERIEVVRNESLCGLLLMWGLNDRPRMTLEYFTPDHRISGEVLISLDAPTPEAMDTARAIVSSLRVEAHAADNQTPQVGPVVSATQLSHGRSVVDRYR